MFAVVDISPTGTILSKSTLISLYSLLIWSNFISALDIGIRALSVCRSDLAFKLASLQ